jgi:DNA helicase-2/ATP-dependent DNA helicase PcrA
MADGPGLEEERRLFYVALTRARQRVMLTAAAFRRRFDGARGGRVSRFVDEIPAALLAREEPAAARPARDDGGARWGGGGRGRVPDDAEGLTGGPAIGWMPPAPARRSKALGRVVFHESFGRGVVVDAEGEGADARYTVRFGTQLKRVLGRFLSGGDHDDPA